MPRSSRRAASTPRSPTWWMRTAPITAAAPGFTGKRVLTDKGEKGDANEAVIKALIDAGMLLARGRLKHQYPHSWRSKKPLIFRNTPQWFIAMDKPILSIEHVATPPAGGGRPSLPPRRHAAPSRARSHQGDPLGAGRRREPDQRHGDEQARLGDLAPARLGRADHRVRARERRRLGRNPQGRARQQAHHRCVRAGRRRRLVRHRRGAPLPRTRVQRQRMGQGRRHSRRLVRFRLDACLRAGRPGAFPRPRRHPAQARRRPRYRDVSRRLRPASRLVSVLAAGILRHARLCAVRRGADPRLHARRARPQDVEVVEERRRAAGRHQAGRRRHSAAVGLPDRLLGRPAHRAGNPQEHRRSLPQAAQHAALDAGLAGAFPRRRPRSAGARCRSSNG